MQSNKEIFKPLKFGSRMRKYILIPYFLDVASTQGNLKEALLKISMKQFDTLLENELSQKISWKPGVDDERKVETFKKLRKGMEERYRKNIEEYLPILFNQALIMVCTICDTFLSDFLQVLTRKKPDCLKCLADKDDIKISEIIDSGNYQKVLNIIRDKVLQRFNFAGIKKKINILKNLGIDTDAAFSLKFHNQRFRNRYPYGYKFLLDSYKKRHDIVHRDQLPLRAYQDLERISTFFDGFMMDLALVAGRRLGIPIDFELFLRDPSSVKID